ncbi:MAG: hypothetical protein ACK4YP_09240, partial [Myxococcota bacterium]
RGLRRPRGGHAPRPRWRGWWLWGRVDEGAAAHAARVELASDTDPGESLPVTLPDAVATVDAAGLSAPVPSGAPPSTDMGGTALAARATPSPVTGRPTPEPVSPRGDASPSGPVRSAVAKPPVAPVPASVVIVLTEPIADLEVWVDGELLGYRKNSAPSSTWIGTSDRPLRLPAGKHTIVLRNRLCEDARVDVTLSEGEPLEIAPPLRRKKVEFMVNHQISNDCKLTIGDMPYEPLSVHRFLSLREPDPKTRVVFKCPDRTIETVIGETVPGQPYVLPARIDP